MPKPTKAELEKALDEAVNWCAEVWDDCPGVVEEYKAAHPQCSGCSGPTWRKRRKACFRKYFLEVAHGKAQSG